MSTARRVADRYTRSRLAVRVAARFAALTEDEERLEERIGEIGDILREAEQLAELIAGDPNGELEKASEHATAIVDALQSAETVETETDLDLNLKEASTEAKALGEELKKAKARVKKDEDLAATLTIVEDAIEATKVITRDLREIEPVG